MSGIKKPRAWFFTTTGDTKKEGFWGRFVGSGISKPTQQTFENLVVSVPNFKEVDSAASVDTGQTLDAKQGLVIVSSDANAKAGNNTAGGSTGGTTVPSPSQLPTTESAKLVANGADDYTTVAGSDVTSITDLQKAALVAKGFDPTASAHIKVEADSATTTRNKYFVRLSNYTLKLLALLSAAKAPTGGTIGQIQKKNSSTDYDSSYTNYGYKSGSTTSVTIGTGSKAFMVGTGYDYAAGNRVRITDGNDPLVNYMEGIVTGYTGGNLYITVDKILGSGTSASWLINLTSLPYTASSASGDTYVGTSTNNTTIATGNKSFTITTGLSYTRGVRTRLASNAATTNYMEGNVVSYNSTTGALVIYIDITGGAGTYNDWNVNIGGANPIAGDSYKTTSTTSLAIGLNLKSFSIGTGYAYQIGTRARATSQATSTNFMEGNVASYSGGVLQINVDNIGGTGTLADWNINIGGVNRIPSEYWIAVSFATLTGGASWADESTTNPCEYFIDAYGIVRLKGLITYTPEFETDHSDINIFTLPVGYRPEYDSKFIVYFSFGGSGGITDLLNSDQFTVEVLTTGVVRLMDWKGGTVTTRTSLTLDLSSISFRSESF